MSKIWIVPLRPIFREHDVLHADVPVELPEDEAQEWLQRGYATFAEPPKLPEPEATPTDSGSKKAKTTVANSTTTPQTQG